MAVTGRLALLAALLLPVVLLRPAVSTVVALLVLLALAVLVDVLLAPGVRGLHMHRRPESDTSARLGETAAVTLVVGNTSSRRLRGVVRDAWRPSAGADRSRHPVDVPAGDSVALTTVLRPVRRGDHHAGPVTVRSVGPLGLAARQGRHDVPWRARALPAFESRKHLPSRLARLRELDGRTAVLVRGEGTELDSLREYVPGDDVRAIDWRATARAADVMVRTWRPERDRHVLVVLDTGRTAAGRVGDAPRLDASMDAALLLAALASRAGDRVDLLAYDRRVRTAVRGESAATVLPAMVDAMADLEPELVETDAPGLVGAVLARTRPRTLVVLLTTLDAEPVRAGLLPVLPTLTARRDVVVCSVADPRVAAAATARGDTEAVYAAAAAERTLGERRRVAEELRRRGAVDVLEAGPDDVAPLLADAYLALKAAGRL